MVTIPDEHLDEVEEDLPSHSEKIVAKGETKILLTGQKEDEPSRKVEEANDSDPDQMYRLPIETLSDVSSWPNIAERGHRKRFHEKSKGGQESAVGPLFKSGRHSSRKSTRIGESKVSLATDSVSKAMAFTTVALENIYYRRVFALYQFQYSIYAMTICIFHFERVNSIVSSNWGFLLFLSLLGMPFGFIFVILLYKYAVLRQTTFVNYFLFTLFFFPQALTAGILVFVTDTLVFLTFCLAIEALSLGIVAICFTQLKVSTLTFGLSLAVGGVSLLIAAGVFIFIDSRNVPPADGSNRFTESTLAEEVIENCLRALGAFLGIMFVVGAFFVAKNHLEMNSLNKDTYSDEFNPVTSYYILIITKPIEAIKRVVKPVKIEEQQ